MSQLKKIDKIKIPLKHGDLMHQCIRINPGFSLPKVVLLHSDTNVLAVTIYFRSYWIETIIQKWDCFYLTPFL